MTRETPTFPEVAVCCNESDVRNIGNLTDAPQKGAGLKYVFLSAVAIFFAACTSSKVSPIDSTAQAVAIGTDGWRDIPDVDDHHPSGAFRNTRRMAVDAYLYAQLAQNAYCNNEYILPRYISNYGETFEIPKSGFAARAYQVKAPGEARYIVVAFRGTNPTSWRDWLYGNILNTQYEQGLDYVKDIRSKLPAGTRIVLTGHSLGGAIATYVSLREKDVSTYGFNASHRISRGNGIENKRVMVAQYGEIAILFRRPMRNPTGYYYVLNLSKGLPIGRHTMRDLGDGLTHIAAWENEAALVSLKANGLGERKRVLK